MTRTRQSKEAAPAVELEVEAEQGSETSAAVETNGAAHGAGEAIVEVCADLPLSTRVEALLFNTDRPITEARIAAVLGLSGKGSSKAVIAAIEELNELYGQSGRSFRAERLAGGWQLLTIAALGPVLNRIHTERQNSKLSQPALETLAIIAYRQPIMRAEVEAIRGVASGEVLRGLMERRLVKIVGRAEELGRPMLYGTTKEFLKVFGLSSVEDLPTVKGIAPGASVAGGSSEPKKKAPEPKAEVDDVPEAETETHQPEPHHPDATS